MQSNFSRLYIALPLILTIIISFGCSNNDNQKTFQDSTHSNDTNNKLNKTNLAKADSLLKKEILLDTIWNGAKMSFVHFDNVKQDSLIISYEGYRSAEMAISEEWLDPDNSKRILVIDNKWKRAPLVFLGDSLCAFSLVNYCGMNRAMILLVYLDKNKKQLHIVQKSDGGNRNDLQGQTYFIVADVKKNIFYLHSSLSSDSNDVSYRSVFKFKAVSEGFKQDGKPWEIYSSDKFDTLLYPYNGYPEGYKKYFTRAFTMHRQ
ncbi:hypothetical protein BH09BAC5_BH09BAC5_17830 [soil metagenome]